MGKLNFFRDFFKKNPRQYPEYLSEINEVIYLSVVSSNNDGWRWAEKMQFSSYSIIDLLRSEYFIASDKKTIDLALINTSNLKKEDRTDKFIAQLAEIQMLTDFSKEEILETACLACEKLSNRDMDLMKVDLIVFQSYIYDVMGPEKTACMCIRKGAMEPQLFLLTNEDDEGDFAWRKKIAFAYKY